jgi:hypothetical protein
MVRLYLNTDLYAFFFTTYAHHVHIQSRSCVSVRLPKLTTSCLEFHTIHNGCFITEGYTKNLYYLISYNTCEPVRREQLLIWRPEIMYGNKSMNNMPLWIRQYFEQCKTTRRLQRTIKTVWTRTGLDRITIWARVQNASTELTHIKNSWFVSLRVEIKVV